MDLREIIKWFIPCCLLFLFKFNRFKSVFVCIFLLHFHKVCSLDVDNNNDYNNSLMLNYNNGFELSGSDFDIEMDRDKVEMISPSLVENVIDVCADKVGVLVKGLSDWNRNRTSDSVDWVQFWNSKSDDEKSMFHDKLFGVTESESSRTFGRPLKKLSMALIPLAFQLGAASTWMMVTALLAAKSVAIGLLLLMLKIAGGAAKVSTLLGSKHEHPQAPAWYGPPQKEVHLHIHNGGHDSHEGPTSHDLPYGPWSRHSEVYTNPGYGSAGLTSAAALNPALAYSINPYGAPDPSLNSGPATINTPYGSYLRIGPPS